MKNIELRLIDFTMIQDNDNELTVSGYVNEVGKYSHELGVSKKFKERILPGVFANALSDTNDIHFLAEHNPNLILASTRNNSLQLIEDDKGLFMKAKISETSYGKDYYTLIKDGILRNMSFGFSVVSDSWKKLLNGTYTRDILELKLFEVSVVTNPAYPQSTISARGLDVIENIKIPDNVEEEIMETKNEAIVDDVQKEEKEIVVEETTVKCENVCEEQPKEAEEKRAYIGGVYGDYDIMNSCLNISAECLSLARYFANENTNTELIKPFKDFAIQCQNIMNNQINEPKQDTIISEEVRTTEEQTDNTLVEEVVDTTVEESVENRSTDLSEFYNMLKEIERKGE